MPANISDALLNILLNPQRQQSVQQDPSISNRVGNVVGGIGDFQMGAANQLGQMFSGPARFMGNAIQGATGASFPQQGMAQAQGLSPQQATQVQPAQVSPPQAQKTSRNVKEFVGAKGDKAKKANERNAMFMEMAKRIGVPLASAIAGSINPNLLPAAAGLAGGYVEGYNRQEDIAREDSGTKPFIVYDPETGEEKEIQVPKKAIVQQKRKSNSLTDFIDFSKLSESIDTPQGKAGDAVKEAQKKIRVINRETQETGTIESDEFNEKLYERL